MEAARTITRQAVSITIGAARFPADTALRFLPGGESAVRTKLTGFVDRADATTREVIGTVLRDPELRADGRRRQLASTERLLAADLKAEAERRRAEADERAVSSITEAEDRRAAARREAEEKAQAAIELREERAAAQRHAAEVRKAKVDEAEAAAQQTVEKKAKRARAKVLDEQVGALDVQDDALVATDEAARLAGAAKAAKAARKAR